MPDKLTISRIDSRRDNLSAELAHLRQRLSPRGNVVSQAGRQKTMEVFGEALTPAQVASRICDDVRDHGLSAVLDYTKRIDGVELSGDTIRVPVKEILAAHDQADEQFLETVRHIRKRVQRFQEAILLKDVRIDDIEGGYLLQRYLPLNRVGICVPGGAAAYPSTVLMTAVPAQTAGVKEIAVVAPPTEYGAYNREILATCCEIGVTEIYRLGGAQGVAALAYGVEGLPRVDKVVGPGNLFVALAKQRIFGEVGIDSIAGPSEVVVIADETARPQFVAADLIAQAEHSPGASILVTWHELLLDATQAALEEQLSRSPRGELARQSLEQFGAFIVVRDDLEAARVADELSPEHLHLAINRPEELLKRISHAGAFFLGHFSPVAVGDYAAGPSHVLPTSGTARFASGLTSNDFLRGNSVIKVSEAGLFQLAEDIDAMARTEGLAAHAESIRTRLFNP